MSTPARVAEARLAATPLVRLWYRLSGWTGKRSGWESELGFPGLRRRRALGGSGERWGLLRAGPGVRYLDGGFAADLAAGVVVEVAW